MLRSILIAVLSTVVVVGPSVAADPFRPNWESLNSRPTPGWFPDAKFGIFIHWGVYSVPSWSVRGQYSEWYWFRITQTDERHAPWRNVPRGHLRKRFSLFRLRAKIQGRTVRRGPVGEDFRRLGCKIRGADQQTSRRVLPLAQPGRQPHLEPQMEQRRYRAPARLVGRTHRRRSRKARFEDGLYYSLYEWYNPLWLADRQRYAVEHMHPQFKDVVTRYAPSLIFSDGEWDMPSSDWKTPELLAWLFNESPCREEVVINDRWGKDERHSHGGYWTTEYGAGLPDASHSWEENRGIAHSFGYSRTEPLEDYRTRRELIWMLADLVSRGGNLLLDVGPTADGRIPVIMQDRLAEIGKWLRVNGEAIYGTRPHPMTCQWSDGKLPQQGFSQYQAKYDITQLVGMAAHEGQARKQAFLTTKPGVLYAILPRWPGKTFTLKGIPSAPGMSVKMLGVDSELDFKSIDGDLVIEMPPLGPGEPPSDYAWTLKIQHSDL